MVSFKLTAFAVVALRALSVVAQAPEGLKVSVEASRKGEMAMAS